jgi:gliding motility-associated-like protein
VIEFFTLILFPILGSLTTTPAHYSIEYMAPSPSEMALACPDAGRDTVICGFEFQLQGSETTGNWRVLCSRSDGIVAFENQDSDTTFVKVMRCGKYEFVYEVPTGPCVGLDTIVVKFKDPSTIEINIGIDIDLVLDVECYAESGTVVCDNSISINGVEPPELDWTICASQQCQAELYTSDFTTILDSCVAADLILDFIQVSDSDLACGGFTDIGSIEILDIMNTLIEGLNTNCLNIDPCFPIPLECIEITLDTTYISVPILDGGQWNFIDDNGDFLPLDDTTLLVIDGVPYAFVINPGSDYSGPGQIDFILWEIGPTGAWIAPTTTVDITLQWVINVIYDKVEVIQPIFTIRDSCDILPCGGVIINPTGYTIPPMPDYPCNPLVLTYDTGPDDMFYFLELNCANPVDFAPTCNGEMEFFDQPGFYTFPCTTSDGCSYEAIVEVLGNFETPRIENIVTTCSSDFMNYSVSFTINGGNGTYDIPGVGQVAQGETVTITNIAECSEFTIQVTDALSFCETEAIVLQCCECTATNAAINATICEGDIYDFEGQTIDTAGIYEVTILNVQGCDSVISLILTVNQGSVLNLNASICEGSSYGFYGQSLSVAGIYSDTTINAQGCIDIENLNLDVMSPDIENVYVRMCAGDIYDFYGQSLTAAGNYTEVLLNQYGCDSIIKLQLDVNALDFQLSSEADCSEGESGVITVSEMQGERAPFTFSLDNVEFTSSSVFENLGAAEYTVYMRDIDGCATEHDIDVPEIEPISITIDESYTLCGNAELQIDLTHFIQSSDDVTFSWDDDSQLALRTFDEAGSYWVELSNVCEQLRKEFTLEYEEASPDNSIYVPNVFTPNGDGINDEFKVYVGAPITEFEFHIYDRWGDNLREFYSTDEAWDGSFLGQDMIPAVYVWWLRAKVEGCDGELSEVLMKGDVTLIK